MIAPPWLPEVEAWQGWEQRWQLTLIEPQEDLPEELPNVGVRPLPRRNLVISRAPATAASALDAAHEFLRHVGSAVPDLHVDTPPAEMTFRDGTAGAQAVVSFQVEGVRLIQVHLFRLDADAMTQIVATADEVRSEEERQEMVTAALSFAP